MKEGYGGEGGLQEGDSTRDWGIDFLGGLLDLQRGLEFWSGIVSVQEPGLLEVLGTRGRISI